MRILRLIIISVIILFSIITIISFFIPSHVSVSRAVQINCSPEKAIEQLGNPVNWKNWYPGADSTEYYYENGIVKGLILDKNKSHYIIISEKKNDQVLARYELPKRKIATGWNIVPANDSKSVTVRWFIDFHLRWYPWEKFSSFIFERIYHPQLKTGLDNLKSYLEK